MKLSLSLLFYLTFQFTAIGQMHPYLLFSHEIERKMANDSLRTSSASYHYTYIGDYLSAIQTYDIPVSWGVDAVKIDDGYQIVDAAAYITKIADQHQIIIISESHLKPQHRIFSRKLLSVLRNKGYKYLGLEALNPDSTRSNFLSDTALQHRGYTMAGVTSGVYANEPQMSRLIRSAIQEGYQIFGYERTYRSRTKDRDEIQAENIIRYLKNNPEGKCIIHCGWYHAIESDTIKRRNSFFMAKYLKEKTGIDPLTIYQDNFTEKVIETEHELLEELNVTTPSVLLNSNGNAIKFSPHVDVEIIHPKTRYRKGRPDWLFENESVFLELPFDSIQIKTPFFLSAFKPGMEDGAPEDIVEIKHPFARLPLVLLPGRYRIKLFNREESKSFDVTLER